MLVALFEKEGARVEIFGDDFEDLVVKVDEFRRDHPDFEMRKTYELRY